MPSKKPRGRGSGHSGPFSVGSDIAGSKFKCVRLSLFHSPSVTGRRRADAAPRVCFNQEQYCREPPLPLPTPVLTPTLPSLFFVPQNKQLVPPCQEDEVHTHTGANKEAFLPRTFLSCWVTRSPGPFVRSHQMRQAPQGPAALGLSLLAFISTATLTPPNQQDAGPGVCLSVIT